MTSAMILWAVGGLAVVLIVMLVVVFVAQSLNKREIADTAKMSAPLTKALGLNRSAGKSEVPEKKKSTTATLVAIGSTVAVLSGVIAFAKEINNGDIVPEVREIAAGELNGTMINARNSDPVVLIVPGSGPTDRDGNNPMGLKTDAYKLLAEGLSEERISTVRVDKRGMFGSAGAGDPNISSPQAYVDDIHAWIDAIKTERGSKCVFLLGHSEGALMVSLAAEGRKDVCGLILVSGMGRKMGDVIREQLTSNPANAPVLGQALGALSELEAGRHVDVTGMHPALLALFNPKVQGYLISMFAIDPVEAVRKANKDTLIVQGERDLQVSVADARLLDKAPHTRLRLIGHMNHVLKDAPEDRAGNIATYSNPSLPLSKDLVKYVRRFVKDKD
jgi:pimeloyl-ACP methyl ester carboxylesterase